jgi:putative intracellular protease/amidase
LWLGEAALRRPRAAGFTVDYVSPAGGYVPIDPHSLQMAPDLDWRWYDDKAFMKRLGATLSPGEVKAEQYSAIYYTGGHGVMWTSLITSRCRTWRGVFTKLAGS